MDDTPKAVPVIIHYANGTLVKCHASDVEIDRASVLVNTTDGTAYKLRHREIKALYWVRDFLGTQGYRETRKFPEGFQTSGRKLGVQFRDGERLVGVTHDDEPGSPGFHLVPADPKSNNLKIWVSRAAVARTIPLH